MTLLHRRLCCQREKQIHMPRTLGEVDEEVAGKKLASADSDEETGAIPTHIMERVEFSRNDRHGSRNHGKVPSAVTIVLV
jgi:hypothetical protein